MYYIGIDLGGTNIKGALVSETGEIAREVSRPTRVELGAEAVCDGIECVMVNGQIAVEDAKVLPVFAGRVLRKGRE